MGMYIALLYGQETPITIPLALLESGCSNLYKKIKQKLNEYDWKSFGGSMESKVLVSEKIQLKKLFSVAWGIAVLFLLIIFIISGIKFKKYHDGQKATITLMSLALNNYGVDTSGDYEEVVQKLYKYIHRDTSYADYLGINTSQLKASADKLDKALAEELSKLGYPCRRATDFLLYIGYPDYSINTHWVEFIIAASIIVLILIANMVYLLDRKTLLKIEDGFVICKSCSGKTRHFMLKEIKSVEMTGLKGLKIKGNTINFRINLIKNRDEVKATIMNFLSEQCEME